MKSCLSLSLSLSLSFFFIKTFSIQAAPTYLRHNCTDTTLFSPNSAYLSNLNTLLSSLSSAATHSTNGFAAATAGQSPPDKAYGLFLCRGDLNISACNDCMATAKEEILQRCPNQRVSLIWYDECMLRYSNQAISSIMEVEPNLLMYNTGNISEPKQFVQVLGETIKEVASRASSGDSLKKFAVADNGVMSSGTLYVLGQCTPDLTERDCNTCLRWVIPILPEGQHGGRILTASCIVRFELYPFYSNAPPSVVPLAPPPTTTDGKSDKSTRIIIVITVPVGVVMVLFILIWLLRRKEKKTHRVVKEKHGTNKLTIVESLEYDLATMQEATNDFSPENKLGEGGFGEVFLTS